MPFENKFGTLAVVAEYDPDPWSMRSYLSRYLVEVLRENWDTSLKLLSPTGTTLPEFLRAPHVEIHYLENHLPAAGSSESIMIHSARKLTDSPYLSNSLHSQIRRNPCDSYVFVGLTNSILPAMAITRKRNCLIPLLERSLSPEERSNPAFVYSLLNCDYILCHSETEAAVLREIQ